MYSPRHVVRPLKTSGGTPEEEDIVRPKKSPSSLKHSNSAGTLEPHLKNNLRQSSSSGALEGTLRGLKSSNGSVDGASASTKKKKSMIDAAAKGDLETLRSLVHAGKNVNRRGIQNTTPLHVASFHDHSECVKYLLNKGASVNATDDDGSTALQNAAFNGSLESLKLLIKGGATLDCHDNDGSTPLHKAAFAGRTECLKYLIRKGASISVLDDSKATPLHHAAANGFVECVDYLLRKGAKPNKRAEDGSTALHRTVASGNIECVSVLLCNSANPNVVDEGQASPLHYAAEYGFVDIAELLIENKADVNVLDNSGASPVHITAYNGYTKLLQLLLEKGAKINNTPDTPAAFSALHHAAFSGQTECVSVLLKFNADVNVVDADNATPLHKAAFSGHADTAQVLVEHGAHVNAQDNEGSTPLHKAAFSGRDRCIKYLLGVGADAAAVDKDKGTSLHNAVFNGHLSSAVLLVEEGKADVNATDYEGTSLHVAVTQGHRAVVEFLLSKGANIHAMGASGMTPIHAAASHSPECLFVLGDAGGDITLLDQKGWAPLHYAVAAGREESAEYLILRGAEVTDSVRAIAASRPKMVKHTASTADITTDILQQMIEKREKLRSEHKEKEYSVAIQEFNKKPEKGIEHLVSLGVITRSPQAIAKFLHASHALSKRKLGEYLGEGDDFSKLVLEAFVEEFDFTELSLDQALRQFLLKFWLPGEAQKIDRFMEGFSKRFCKNNPTHFTNPDTAYLLAFAVIMLNTDAHNPSIKRENKMTLEQFLYNTRAIPGIADVKPGYLEKLYSSIVVDEIQFNTEGSVFSNVSKKGFMTKQGGRIKTWKERWFVLNGSLLYYFKTPTDTEPLGIIPLENVDVKVSDMRGKKFCFGIYSNNSGGEMKGAKLNNGLMEKGHHEAYILCCDSKESMESWISCIGNNIYSTPINDLIQNKTKNSAKLASPDTKVN